MPVLCMGLKDVVVCKIARLPDEKYLFRQAIVCKQFYNLNYSADSSETESFFFLDLPEIIL